MEGSATTNIVRLLWRKGVKHERSEGESPGPESMQPMCSPLQIPGANVWCVIVFLTLFFLGIDSAFSLLEAITTVICDAEFGGMQVEKLVRQGFWDSDASVVAGKPLRQFVSVCMVSKLATSVRQVRRD